MADSTMKRTPLHLLSRRAPHSLHPASDSRVSTALHEPLSQLYAIQISHSGALHADDRQWVGQVSGNGHSYVLKLRVRGAVPAALLVLPPGERGASTLTRLTSPSAWLPSAARADASGAFRVQPALSAEANLQYGSSAYQLDEYVWNHRDCLICLPGGSSEPSLVQALPSIFTESASAARNGITSRAGSASGSHISDARRQRVVPTNDSKAPHQASSQPALFPRAMPAERAREPRWADSLTFFDSGSILATPLVASCCAMIRQYLVSVRGIACPSAALVKALFIDGAADIRGQYLPSESSTTDSVKVTASIGPEANGIRLLQDEARPLEAGEEKSFVIAVPPETRELRATLVWTDQPGAALQNDLDLIVTSGGQARHGNMAPGSLAFDRSRNVEQVLWDSPSAGEATITVRAFRAVRSAQSFALLVRIR